MKLVAKLFWLAAWGAFTSLFSQVPPNDAFENRQVLTGSNVVAIGRLGMASLEADEPDHSPAAPGSGWEGANQSIWWTWKAPGRGNVTITASESSSVDKVIAVYSGDSLGSLVAAGQALGDDLLALAAVPDQVFQIAAVSDNDLPQTIVLALRFYASPPSDPPLAAQNDDFADRIILKGKSGTLTGSVLGATGEASLNEGPDWPTLWWEWTAPEDGVLLFSRSIEVFKEDLSRLEAFDRQKGFAVKNGSRYFFRRQFEGESSFILDATRVLSPRDSVVLTGPADLLVKLQLDEEWEKPTNITVRVGDALPAVVTNSTFEFRNLGLGRFPLSVYLRYETRPARALPQLDVRIRPANDDFADATPLDLSKPIYAKLSGASRELDEPQHSTRITDEPSTVWWKWRPEADYRVCFWDGFSLALYEGDSLARLKKMPFVFGSGGAYEVFAGREYRLAGYGRESDYPLVSPIIYPRPLNDNFSDAAPLTIGKTIRAMPFLASREDTAAESLGMRTLWWKWTAETDGMLRLAISTDTTLREATIQNATLSCLLGSAIDSLKPMTNSVGSTVPRSSFEGAVSKGQTVFIRVASTGLYSVEEVFLNSNFSPAPVNDDFTGSTAITSIPFFAQVVTSPQWLSRQAGEPAEGKDASGTLWWEWRAPADMEIACVVFPYGTFRTFIGTTLENLTKVGATNRIPGFWRFNARAGEVYKIQLNAPISTEASLYIAPAEPNDNFRDALPLAFPERPLPFSFLGTTIEPGEPVESSYGRVAGTLWWKFAPETDGILQTTLGVYSGSSAQSALKISPFKVRNGTNQYLLSKGTEYHLRAIYTARSEQNEDWIRGDISTYQFDALDFTSPPAESAHDFGDPVTISLPRLTSIYDGEFQSGLLKIGRLSSSPEFETRIDELPFQIVRTDLAPGEYIATWRMVNKEGVFADSPERRFIVREENDNFARARVIDNYANYISSAGLTLDPWEAELFPANVSGSAWFKCVASQSGAARISGTGLFAIAKEDSQGKLTWIREAQTNVIDFTAVQGQSYRLAVLTTNGQTGGSSFTLSYASLADSFASAINILGEDLLMIPLIPSTLEPGEPAENDDSGSIWLRADVPRDGFMDFDLRSVSLDAVSFWKGTALDNLISAPYAFKDSVFRVEATRGERLYLRAARKADQAQSLLARARSTLPMLNDDFRDALSLTGFSVEAMGANGEATLEATEPLVSSRGERRTVWYSWRAPANGNVQLSGDANHVFELFSGKDLPGLTPTPAVPLPPWASDAGYQTFLVEQGTEYFIRVQPRSRWDSEFAFWLESAREWPIAGTDPNNKALLSGDRLDVRGHTAGTFGIYWRWIAPRDGVVRMRQLTPDAHVYVTHPKRSHDPALDPNGLGGGLFVVEAGDTVDFFVGNWRPREFAWTAEYVQDSIPPETIVLPTQSPVSVDIPFSTAPGPLDLTGTKSEVFWTRLEWTAPWDGELIITGSFSHVLYNVRMDGVLGWNPTGILRGGRKYVIQVAVDRDATVKLEIKRPLVRTDLVVSDEGLILNAQSTVSSAYALEGTTDLTHWETEQMLQIDPTPISLFRALSPNEPYFFYRWVPVSRDLP